MIRVALRFDDPGPASDHAVEREIIAELERFGLCATFAVIPFRAEEGELRGLERDAVPHLLEAQRKGVIEIALHGHSHTCIPGCAPGQSSEFVGLGVGEQETLIREGKCHLEDVFESGVEGFVPPWNSADHATLEALANLGFRYCSSDITTAPGYTGNIRRIPRTCQLQTCSLAFEDAQSFRMLSPVVVIVFHHYDFNTKGCFGLERFQQLLERLSEDPHVQTMTLAQLSQQILPLQSVRALRHYEIRRRAHWRIQHFFPSYCLAPAPLWFVFLSRFLAGVGGRRGNTNSRKSLLA
ncbi:MAG: DUF2334 domain-containing protein [Thiobacillaceae bacterium]|jgi:hypothetical protein|nr:DUF2334 domain-containing protein [Thiobacillaceae bacterium]